MLSLAGLGSYFFFYQIYRRNWARALMTVLAAFIVLVLFFMLAPANIPNVSPACSAIIPQPTA